MRNFEDTLVNPNNSAGNYKPLNSVFMKSSDGPINAKNTDNNSQRANKINPAGIFALGLFLILTVTFVFVVSHAF